MKARALAELIMLVQSFTGEQSEASSVLATHFAATSPTATASSIVKKLAAALTTARRVNNSAPLRDAQPTLRVVAQIAGLSSTPAVAAVCRELLALAESNPDLSVRDLTAPPARTARAARETPPVIPNVELVQKHTNALLTKSPGTEAFGEVLNQLKADTKVRAAEMRLIADRVGVKVPEAAARTSAFNKIAREHKIILDAAAKSAAMRGSGSA